jgi:hypothetical protein
MWWLLPVIGAGAAIIAGLNLLASSERKRFEQNRERVYNEVTFHCNVIEHQLRESQEYLNFKSLIDTHYASVQIANQAHALLGDARVCVAAIGKSLYKARKRRDQLKEKLKRCKSKKRKKELAAEIADLVKLRKALFLDRDDLIEQRDKLLAEVRRLNRKTARLKAAVRDRCGWRGELWFQRLEERTRQKRVTH